MKARAHANLALVKYWGKRDVARNLPAAGSLSVTLEALTTTTEVRFDAGLDADEVVIDDRPRDGAALERCKRILDAVRERSGLTHRARVASRNDFPYAAGLASSASGMAALTVAAAGAAGWQATRDELSEVARIGSGSATRSIHGGFVLWPRGERADGGDSHGTPLYDADYWDLRVLVAVVGDAPKKVPSTEGMLRTAATSPCYPAWLEQCERDLDEAGRALSGRDLERLGRVSESSTLRMHATAMAAEPGILYWTGATLDLLRLVRRLREERGLAAWFSVDAGPHVKVLVPPENAGPVASELRALPGVDRVIESRVGGPAEMRETP